jgi:31-O-methyltransferase
MRQLSLSDGLTVFSLNADETRFVHREVFVDRCYLQHGIELHDGDCVFDVGANIGLSTLFFHRERPNVRIYAFEPSPAACECLRANIQLHGVAAHVFECGLSEASGTAEFTFYPSNSVMSGFHANAAADRATTRAYMINSGFAPRHADLMTSSKFKSVTFPCPLKTLSEVIDEENIDSVDLLKIDVEKSELEVLAGIHSDHWGRIGQIVVEVDDNEQRLDQVRGILADHGFAITSTQDPALRATPIFTVFASRP